MTELREKMIKAMELRNFSPITQTAYLSAVTNLAMHYMKSPEEISQDEIEDYLLYLKKDRKLSYSTRNQAISGLKFFYNETLKNPDMILQLPRKKTPVKLPEVLSVDEVKRVINAPNNMKHRMILMTTYSAGLRVSELVRLEPRHIVSSRMLILVEDGKGVKDRYTILSKTLLENLRQYWQSYRPTKWLFPSTNPQNHISRSTAQKLFTLTVGTPVTQRPPHSPGRAVFPHPVPRLYSLSRKASALGKHPMLFGRYRQLGFRNAEALDSFEKNLPSKTLPFPTSTVQPLKCTFDRPTVKLPQRPQVADHAVIIVMTTQPTV